MREDIPDTVWVVVPQYRVQATWFPERWIAEAVASTVGGTVRRASRVTEDIFGLEALPARRPSPTGEPADGS